MLYQKEQKKFLESFKTTYDVSFFKIRLDLDGLVLVLSFEKFLSSFVKMADFQSIKDSSDIFLSDNSLHLIRLSKFSMMYSFFFFFSNWWSLVPCNWDLYLKSYQVLFMVICKSLGMMCP